MDVKQIARKELESMQIKYDGRLRELRQMQDDLQASAEHLKKSDRYFNAAEEKILEQHQEIERLRAAMRPCAFRPYCDCQPCRDRRTARTTEPAEPPAEPPSCSDHPEPRSGPTPD